MGVAQIIGARPKATRPVDMDLGMFGGPVGQPDLGRQGVPALLVLEIARAGRTVHDVTRRQVQSNGGDIGSLFFIAEAQPRYRSAGR